LYCLPFIGELKIIITYSWKGCVSFYSRSRGSRRYRRTFHSSRESSWRWRRVREEREPRAPGQWRPPAASGCQQTAATASTTRVSRAAIYHTLSTSSHPAAATQVQQTL